MKTATLGGTGVTVTALGFGGAPIGNLYASMPDEQARAAIDAAWDGGVRYFDTAPHYGLGLSERRLGEALRQRPRDQFTISTKVGRLLVPNPHPSGSDLADGGFAVADDLIREFDFSRDGVLRSIEASLGRLGLDRIDVVYVHDPDDHLEAAITQAIPALAELRDQGVIAAIGAGMNTVAPLLRLVTSTDIDVVMAAGRWTLLDRTAEPLLRACARRGVSFVAAAPFNSGLLAAEWPSENARFDYAQVSPARLTAAREFAVLAGKHAITLPQLAIQFAGQCPTVACVVAGMSSAAESVQDVQWMTAPIPEEVWQTSAISAHHDTKPSPEEMS